jgi:hypothetical protein
MASANAKEFFCGRFSSLSGVTCKLAKPVLKFFWVFNFLWQKTVRLLHRSNAYLTQF